MKGQNDQGDPTPLPDEILRWAGWEPVGNFVLGKEEREAKWQGHFPLPIQTTLVFGVDEENDPNPSTPNLMMRKGLLEIGEARYQPHLNWAVVR